MNLKERRLRIGMNQSELAKRMSVTQGIVSQWENQKIMPSSDKLPKLAEALQCSIDELFEDSSEEQ
ncbi:MAG: helix-turn-helix transcriptional regulator [Clostridiales bacterium]|nr:helix-turn-helix transcriptional regulator [Clostridiales bacterium]